MFVPRRKFICTSIHSEWSLALIFMKEMVNIIYLIVDSNVICFAVLLIRILRGKTRKTYNVLIKYE